MKRLGRVAAAAATILTPASAVAAEVTVFAAASLSEAVTEVARGYEAATAHRVVLSFGASSALARQIRAGAPADLFFSADLAQMDNLIAAKLVRPEDRVDLLSNVLVVVVHAGAPSPVAAPADLSKVSKLAMADPEAVPAGVYARQWLESAGLWEAVQPRVVPLLDVRAALAAVASGNADAGIVYRTDAAASRRVKVAFEVPRERGPAIVYPLARLAAARNPAAGEALRYFASEAARAIYARHGFVLLSAR